MVYKRVRGWTSGRSLPVKNFVEYPPGLNYLARWSKKTKDKIKGIKIDQTYLWNESFGDFPHSPDNKVYSLGRVVEEVLFQSLFDYAIIQ